MKQVTIETVRGRMNELGQGIARGGLSLREEFELACLGRLLESMVGEPLAYIFQHPAGKLFWALTDECNKDIDGVVPVFAGVQPGVDDDVRNIIGLLESNEWAEHCTATVLGSRLESEITRLVGSTQPGPVVVIPTIWKHYGGGKVASLYEQAMDEAGVKWRSVDDEPQKEPATDNTAQQFEALTRGQQMKRAFDAMNGQTSQAEDDMICHGERCKVCDEMIIGRSIDGLCVCCRDDLKSDPETVRGRDI